MTSTPPPILIFYSPDKAALSLFANYKMDEITDLSKRIFHIEDNQDACAEFHTLHWMRPDVIILERLDGKLFEDFAKFAVKFSPDVTLVAGVQASSVDKVKEKFLTTGPPVLGEYLFNNCEISYLSRAEFLHANDEGH
jgi:hypothetical protein